MLGSIKGAKRANKTFLHCVGILAANGCRPGAKNEREGRRITKEQESVAREHPLIEIGAIKVAMEPLDGTRMWIGSG